MDNLCDGQALNVNSVNRTNTRQTAGPPNKSKGLAMRGKGTSLEKDFYSILSHNLGRSSGHHNNPFPS